MKTVESGKKHFYPGCIVVLDLDNFEDVVRERGWSEYKPNPVTGMLTQLVERLVVNYRGVPIYGLDEERGTEEAVIEFPGNNCSELQRELEAIKERINELNIGITIVCINAYVSGGKSRSRRESYYGTPWRRYALKILRKAKRRGGNTIIIIK